MNAAAMKEACEWAIGSGCPPEWLPHSAECKGCNCPDCVQCNPPEEVVA